MRRLRDFGHSSSSAFRLMKYGAWTLIATPCSSAVCLIAAQVASETRTDCTQPNSNASSPMDLLNAIAPTEPPGFLGVPIGEPTVPKRNDRVTMPPFYHEGHEGKTLAAFAVSHPVRLHLCRRHRRAGSPPGRDGRRAAGLRGTNGVHFVFKKWPSTFPTVAAPRSIIRSAAPQSQRSIRPPR